MKRRLFSLLLCLVILAVQLGPAAPHALAESASEPFEADTEPSQEPDSGAPADPDAPAPPDGATEGPEGGPVPPDGTSGEPTESPAPSGTPEGTAPTATPEGDGSAGAEQGPVSAASVSGPSGEQFFGTIEEAWQQAAAEPGSSLTLLQDVTITGPLTLGEGEVLFHGGAYTIQAVDGPVFRLSGGELKLEDGAVKAGRNPEAEEKIWLTAVEVTGGKLTVSQAQITSEVTAVTVSGGELTMQGGSLTGGEDGAALLLTGEGRVTLEGGSVTGASGLQVQQGTLAMTGGSAACTGPALAVSGGTVSLSGGDLTGQPAVSVTEGTVSDLLATGCCFLQDDREVSPEDLQTQQIVGRVTIERKEETAVYAAQVTVGEQSSSYLTLEEAWSAARAVPGATVHLLQDAVPAEPLTVTEGESVTWDGGAYSLTSSGEDSVFSVQGGSLTLAGGTVSGGRCGVLVENGTLTVAGGSLTGSEQAVCAGGGTVEIRGGRLAAGTEAGLEVLGAYVVIADGTIEAGESAAAAVAAQGGKTEIAGGTIAGGQFGLYAGDTKGVVLRGGTFTGSEAALAAADGQPVRDMLAPGYTFAGEGEEEGPETGDRIPGLVRVVPGEPEFSARLEQAKKSGEPLVLTENLVMGETISVAEGETLLLEGGEYSLSGEGEAPLIRVEQGGSFTLRSGTLRSDLGPCLVVDSGARLTVEGGEIFGGSYGIAASGSVEVTGGAVRGGAYALCVVGSLETINDQGIGAKLSETISLPLQAEVSLSGGTFQSDYAALYAEDPEVVTLTGGVFIGGEAAVAVPASLSVRGMLAEGYEFRQDGKTIENTEVDALAGSVSVMASDGQAAAEVTIGGETKAYGTLEEAWAAAAQAESAVVTVKADWSVGAPLALTAGHAVTLEGEACTITGTGASVFTVNGGALTVNSGIIRGREYAVRAFAGAAVTVAGGEISAERYTVTGADSAVAVSGGTLTSGYTPVYLAGGTGDISGGTIVSTSTGSGWGVTVTEQGKLTIRGGEMRGSGSGSGLFAQQAEVEVSGGAIHGGANGIRAVQGAAIAFSGGSAQGDKYGLILAEEAAAEIAGGSLQGYCGVRVNDEQSEMQITAGTVTAQAYGVYVSGGKAVIDGQAVIDSQYNGACLFGGRLEIRGGSIRGIGEEKGWGLYISSGTATVLGGEIEGSQYGVQANRPTAASLGGGTFTGAIAVKTGQGQSVGMMLQSGCTYVRDGQPIEDTAGEVLEGTVTVERISEGNLFRVLKDGAIAEYDSLQEAWQASRGGIATVQLMAPAQIETTLTVEEGDAITLAGDYTLTGPITQSETEAPVIEVKGGSFTLDGTTMQGDQLGLSVLAGTAAVHSGTLSASKTAIAAAGGSVEISGGEISGSRYGLVCSNNSAVSLSGGLISSPYNGIYMSSGSLTMTGGTVRNTGDPVWAVYVRGGRVRIAGGSISSTRYGIMTSQSQYVSLSGGTVQSDLAVSISSKKGSVQEMLASGCRYMRDGLPVTETGGYVLAGSVTVEKDPSLIPPTAPPTQTPAPTPGQEPEPPATLEPPDVGGSTSGSGTGGGAGGSGSGDSGTGGGADDGGTGGGAGGGSTSSSAPQTGDETRMLPWILVLSVSGGALLLLTGYSLRRGKQQSK